MKLDAAAIGLGLRLRLGLRCRAGSGDEVARTAGRPYAPDVPSNAAENPVHRPMRHAVLTGLIAAGGGGRRAFVDATGTPMALPTVIRRVVATDDEVGALLLELGAPVVGCAGMLDDVEAVGARRAPNPQAVAALRPDVIVTGAVDGVHDLADAGLVEALRRVAPTLAVDVGRRSVAVADLRALLGPVVGGGRPATVPMSDRRVGAPLGKVLLDPPPVDRADHLTTRSG